MTTEPTGALQTTLRTVLQSDLEAIYRWAEDVNMVFNADTSEMLRYWPKAGTKPDNFQNDPDGNQIEEKAHLRDLGVEMASDLPFQIHIEYVLAVANKLVGWALRNLQREISQIIAHHLENFSPQQAGLLLPVVESQ